MESAAALHNIPCKATSPDVHLLIDRGCRKRLALPRIDVGNTHLPAAQIIRHEWVVAPEVEDVEGVLVTSVRQTILDMLRLTPPADGVTFGCMALRKLVGFDRNNPEVAMERAKSIKAGILKRLKDEYPHDRRFRQAIRLLALLTPAVDSVFEATMVWVCHLAGLPAATLQYKLRTARTTRYLDAYYPAVGLVLEFDGLCKLGFSFEQELRERRRQQVRDLELEACGLRVVHVQWAELEELGELVSRLKQMFVRLGGMLLRAREWITYRMKSWEPRGSTGWY